MSNPIRVATAALSGRVFAGRPTKDGMGFKEPRYDVTSDVLVAIRDMVGVGHEIEVTHNGVVEFRIAVLPHAESFAPFRPKLDMRPSTPSTTQSSPPSFNRINRNDQ